MQRRTLFATAIALVIGLAASYLLRRQQGREATQMAAGESARAVADASGGAVVALAVGTAVIEGEVQFTGAAPTAGKLHREADPYCARREMTDPTVLVANGRLANAWVPITKGAPGGAAPATPGELDQQDCMYAPRATTAVVAQEIGARYDDPILANSPTSVGAS